MLPTIRADLAFKRLGEFQQLVGSRTSPNSCYGRSEPLADVAFEDTQQTREHLAQASALGPIAVIASASYACERIIERPPTVELAPAHRLRDAEQCRRSNRRNSKIAVAAMCQHASIFAINRPRAAFSTDRGSASALLT